LTVAGQNLFGGGANTYQALQYFLDAKLTKNQATGLVANLYAESGLNPDRYGSGDEAKGGKSEAYGIAQWHKDRQEEFKKFKGYDIHGSSLQDQLDFVAYELQHKEQAALKELLKAKTVDEAVRAGLSYERPDPNNRERDYNRRMDIANTIEVKVFNNTGGNAIATASALPGVNR
jgi:hypothetical protein